MAHSGAARSRKPLAVAVMLLVGLSITVTLAWRAQSQRENAVATDTEARTVAVADELSTAVDDAFSGTAAIAAALGESWPNPADYQGRWDTLMSFFPGNSYATTILAIPQPLLDANVAAEKALNPTFEARFVNADPPPGGHYLMMRTSDNSALLSGIDISSFPDQADELELINIGDVRVTARDVREPELEPAPGQLQLFARHKAVGPDGGTYDAWTGVQLDLAAIITQAVGTQPDAFGVTVWNSRNPTVETRGMERTLGVAESPLTFEYRGVVFTVIGHSDGSLVRSTDPTQVLVVGTVISTIAAALTALGLLFNTLMNRIDLSEAEARHDELTGLPNRRWLLEHLAQHGDNDVALLFCDLDRFKVVNDSAGHTVGDHLLRQVATRFVDTLDGRHQVARFGGDEFIVLCTGEDTAAAAAGAASVAAEITEAIAQPFDLGDADFRSSISIGIAVGRPSDPAAIDELVRAADTALVECKRNGRNGFRMYNPSMREIDTGRLVFEQELRAALDRGELTVHYQPLVNESREVFSYEALVRWRRGDQMVSPAEFLPVVDEIDRMVDLGKIVLDVAIAQLAEWTDSGVHGEEVTLHVNLDPAQLVDDGFPGLVMSLLTANGVSPARLVLELTENELMDIGDRTQRVLRALSSLGVGIAIDDFGTGYSSIARVLDIEGLTEIKIDRSIVQRLADPSGRSFLVGFVDMAASLDVTLIAEGVETVDEHRALLEAGVTHFQGFLFGRPEPAELIGLAASSPIAALPSPEEPSHTAASPPVGGS